MRPTWGPPGADMGPTWGRQVGEILERTDICTKYRVVLATLTWFVKDYDMEKQVHPMVLCGVWLVTHAVTLIER